MVLENEDFYSTLELTGDVYFNRSNGPTTVVLRDKPTEYELQTARKTRGVPQRRGKAVIRSGAQILSAQLGVFLSFLP
jgi:hypothetical protein